MSEPKRYAIRGFSAALVEEKNGVFVRYEDYARLKEDLKNCRIAIRVKDDENARLKAAGDTLVAAYCMGDRNKERWAEYPVVREWLAAKGGLK